MRVYGKGTKLPFEELKAGRATGKCFFKHEPAHSIETMMKHDDRCSEGSRKFNPETLILSDLERRVEHGRVYDCPSSTVRMLSDITTSSSHRRCRLLLQLWVCPLASSILSPPKILS